MKAINIDTQNIKLTPSLLLLLFMNFIPIAGVFLFQWDVGTLFLLYWLETLIIGALNIPKILSAKGKEKNGHRAPQRMGVGGKIFICVFFCVHFGVFTFGHYSFLDTMFRTIPPLPKLWAEVIGTDSLVISALGLVLSHFVSMIVNFYGKKEYETRSPSLQMFIPYARIFIMHFVIIIGGALVLFSGETILALILLVGLKTGLDVISHSIEHQTIKVSLNDKASV